MFVREHMKANPFSDAVYVFRVKRADRIQLIFRTERVCGLCLFAKRLRDGVFRWSKIEDGVMRLSARNCRRCSKGLDGRRVHAPRETIVPTQAGELWAVLWQSESGASSSRQAQICSCFACK